MIICLEGPSAVGKTTTCLALAEQMGGCTVPEVNALFARPAEEAQNWYLERQAVRWEIAQKQSASPLAVLDGDVFQPLWYNWAYGFVGWQDLEALSKFFRPLIETGTLGFPGCYIYLFANETELRRRKEADQTRTRRNFEAHLRLIDVQSRYFRALSCLAPGMVHPVEAESVEASIRSIKDKTAIPVPNPPSALELFDGLTEWLRSNRA